MSIKEPPKGTDSNSQQVAARPIPNASASDSSSASPSGATVPTSEPAASVTKAAGRESTIRGLSSGSRHESPRTDWGAPFIVGLLIRRCSRLLSPTVWLLLLLSVGTVTQTNTMQLVLCQTTTLAPLAGAQELLEHKYLAEFDWPRTASDPAREQDKGPNRTSPSQGPRAPQETTPATTTTTTRRPQAPEDSSMNEIDSLAVLNLVHQRHARWNVSERLGELAASRDSLGSELVGANWSELHSNRSKSLRSVGADLLLASDMARNMIAEASSQQGANSKQHECALILKRTYIFDDDPSEETAGSSPTDEWGERFVFHDSDLEDERAPHRPKEVGASGSERHSLSKRHGGRRPAASGMRIKKSDLCIKHSDVDKAIEEAKHKIKFKRPEDMDSEDISERSIGSIGELNLATGLLLTKRFDLSHDEIINALPMIDLMSKSHQRHHKHQMHDLCPGHMKTMMCTKTRYRTITAHCNNLKHPTWGASKTPYSRYLPPDYADGLNAPRAARDGKPLPSARLITSTIHVDADQPSHDYSMAFADWGQLLNHDITRVAVGEAPDCCPHLLKGLCMPIPVPPNDPLYSEFNVKCLKFERSLAAARPKCLLGHRAQINLITSPVDASFVYGSTRAQANQLRAHKGGKMRVWNYFEKLKLKPLLPPKLEQRDKDCIARPKNLYCFDAGDVRVNEQTHLTVLHTIYLREHNRIAKQLAELNIDWDDDKIYQETRHIVAAGMQHVMMNEFAPLLLGSHYVEKYKLKPMLAGFWMGYDPSVTISTGTGFAAAGFRYGHSMIEGTIRRMDPLTGRLIEAQLLRFLFKRPFMLYEPGAIDQLLAGMLLSAAEQADPFVSEELSGHLFQPPKAQFGHDLPAINIQRGRDQGVPGYNDWREWCGMPRARSFDDLEPLLANRTARLYAKIYKHVDDIDLWSAGVSERKIAGAAVGPTMACIIARQFLNYKRGDRFWYENGNQPSSFSEKQLREIRKITLAKIICTNADHFPKIQPWAMRLPHPIYNAKVPCDSLPTMNLKLWDSSLGENFD